MLPLLVLLVITQVPCTPHELSLVCHCKQGMASACEAVRGADPGLAAELEKSLAKAAVLHAAGEVAEKEAVQTQEQEASSAPEPPDCKGQEHHVISRLIARALERHGTLAGLYKPRDSRLIAKAKDEAAHCGYQEWHRKVDQEVVAWLNENKQATAKEFEQFLLKIYSRPEMKARFPHGFSIP